MDERLADCRRRGRPRRRRRARADPGRSGCDRAACCRSPTALGQRRALDRDRAVCRAGSISISRSSSRDGSSSTTIARLFIASRKRRGIDASASATRRSNRSRSTAWFRDDGVEVVAFVLHGALVAQRLRLADAAAVQDQGVGGARPPRLAAARRTAAASTATASSPSAMPMRLRPRSTCRSTGSPGTPSAWPRTTLAVLRPTPGSVDERVHVGRHVAAVFVDERLRHADQRLRLRAKEPGRMNLRLELRRSSPWRALCASGYRLNSAGVTMFTR